MIATAISAGLGALNTIIGAVNSARNQRKMDNQIKSRLSENEAWMRANSGDYLMRADARSAMAQMRNQIEKANKTSQNNAITGGITPEAQAAMKARMNDAIAQGYLGLAQQGQAYKDNVMNTYLSRKDNLQNMQLQSYNQMAESGTNQMYNGMNMLGTLGTSFLNGLPSNTQNTTIPSPQSLPWKQVSAPVTNVTKTEYNTGFGKSKM
jgi:hypothetical protein